MPDILDAIQADQTAAAQTSLQSAYHDSQWANTFASIPPVEKLRAARNLTDQVDAALTRRLELAAQTNEKAQNMLLKRKAFDAEKQLEPLKKQYLESQIDHQKALTAASGAHDLYQIEKDKAMLADQAGFFSEAASLKPGTSDYPQALAGLIQKYPRIIGTQTGMDALKSMHQEHQDVLAITPPEGMTVDHYEADSSGRMKAIFKPSQSEGPSFASPDEARAHYGADATIRQNPKGQWSASIRPEKTATESKLPPGVTTTYSKSLGEISGLQEQMKSATKAEDKSLIAAKITKHEETVRSLEAMHPDLRATRGLPPTTAPAAPGTAYVPTGRDPRIALAQKALTDPNATEAHKQAARKILGQ